MPTKKSDKIHLCINLPRDLHEEFIWACGGRRVKTQIVIALIKKYIKGVKIIKNREMDNDG